jgi:hypothetical protein
MQGLAVTCCLEVREAGASSCITFSAASTAAPASSSCLTNSVRPSHAARCRGVQPHCSSSHDGAEVRMPPLAGCDSAGDKLQFQLQQQQQLRCHSQQL